MKEINEVIDVYGGRPGAFAPGAARAPDSLQHPPSDHPPAVPQPWQMTCSQYQAHCKAQGRADVTANNRVYWRNIEASQPVLENVLRKYHEVKRLT